MTNVKGTLVAIARKSKPGQVMEEVNSATIDVDTGIEGDWRGTPRVGGPDDRQISVLSAEAWQSVCQDVGNDLPWTYRRANLLVKGLELSHTTGDRLTLGPVTLEITCETVPCERMDEQLTGLTQALVPDWRGGVCCRVISGGSIKVGQSVTHLTNSNKEKISS